MPYDIGSAICCCIKQPKPERFVEMLGIPITVHSAVTVRMRVVIFVTNIRSTYNMTSKISKNRKQYISDVIMLYRNNCSCDNNQILQNVDFALIINQITDLQYDAINR